MSTILGTDGNVSIHQENPNIVEINREMARRPRIRYEDCLGVNMSPAQREVFLIVDEWWKKWGHSPTLRQIMDVRGRGGLANTKRLVDKLVDLGVLKRMKNRRSIRPVYVDFRKVE